MRSTEVVVHLKSRRPRITTPKPIQAAFWCMKVLRVLPKMGLKEWNQNCRLLSVWLWSQKFQDLNKIRQAFEDNKHPRFMKHFFYHQPYGRGNLFNELIDKADFDKLAKLIKIVGLLLQTKAYLFWRWFRQIRVRRQKMHAFTSWLSLFLGQLVQQSFYSLLLRARDYRRRNPYLTSNRNWTRYEDGEMSELQEGIISQKNMVLLDLQSWSLFLCLWHQIQRIY